MKKIAAIFVILILALGGVYTYYSKNLSPRDVPANVFAAENAIAAIGTIALASIDMEYVRRIDRFITGEKDPSPLPSPLAKETLLRELSKKGFDLVKQTNYALAAINVNEKPPNNIIVLLGDYPVNEIKRELRKQYQLVADNNTYLTVGTKLKPDEDDPCESPRSKKTVKQTLKAVDIQKHRIIISSPLFMPTILRRFRDSSVSEVDLKQWQRFRSDKVAAGAFLSPKKARKGATDFLTSAIYKNVSEQPLEAVYAGATFNLLPPQGLNIIVDAHSKNTAWPLSTKKEYDNWLDSAVLNLKAVPTLASLIQSLSVNADGKILRSQASVDKTTVANIEKIPSELLGMLFSSEEVVNKGPAHSGEEKLAQIDNLDKYKPHFSVASIPAFDDKNVFYKPDVISGPFAIFLKSIEILPTDDSIIQLTIKAEGKGFENVSRQPLSKSASLKILSVVNTQGENILKEEKCGPLRNHARRNLHVYPDKEYINNKWIVKSLKVEGEKKIRLKKNIDMRQVKSIKGETSIEVATQTKSQRVNPPFAGKLIETKNVRMFFKDAGPSDIAYDLSGQMGHILAVNALNSKGQYLAGNGKSYIGDEESKSINSQFAGVISSVEVVYAEKLERKIYAFEIKNIAPKYAANKTGKQPQVSENNKKSFLRKHKSQKYDKPCPSKKKAKLGPFLVCMNKFEERWGRETGGEFEVFAPAANGLRKNLAAIELNIDSLTTNNGEKLPFGESKNVNLTYLVDSKYSRKKKNWVKHNARMHANYVQVYSDKEEYRNKKIKSIKGSLKIRLPKKLKRFSLGARDLGVLNKSKDGISAKISRFENWDTYIELNGKIGKIVQLLPRSENGMILATGNDRITEKKVSSFGMSDDDKAIMDAKPKTWEGYITIYGKPKTIEIVYANKFDTINYPFEFDVEK